MQKLWFYDLYQKINYKQNGRTESRKLCSCWKVTTAKFPITGLFLPQTGSGSTFHEVYNVKIVICIDCTSLYRPKMVRLNRLWKYKTRNWNFHFFSVVILDQKFPSSAEPVTERWSTNFRCSKDSWWAIWFDRVHEIRFSGSSLVGARFAVWFAFPFDLAARHFWLIIRLVHLAWRIKRKLEERNSLL